MAARGARMAVIGARCARSCSYTTAARAAVCSLGARQLHGAPVVRRSRATSTPAPHRATHTSAAATPTPAVTGAELTGDDGVVLLQWADGVAARFHAEWLRDHCQCPACWDHRTTQRRISLHEWSMPEGSVAGAGVTGVRVSGSEAVGEVVERSAAGVAGVHASLRLAATEEIARQGGGVVEATVPGRDGAHTVVLAGGHLRQHAYWPANDAAVASGMGAGSWARDKADLREALPRRAFRGGDFDGGRALPSVTLEELQGRRGLFKLLRDIHVHGVGTVTGVPLSEEATEAVVRRVAFPAASLYSQGMWVTEIRPDSDNDTAYTADDLPPHTDGTYLGDMPGLQVFHALVSDAPRGRTLLVDGLAVADDLRERHPAAFDFFCRQRLPFFKVDDTHDLREMRRVITVDPDTGDFAGIAFNDVDRAPVHLPADVIPRFYEHMRDLSALCNDPRNALWTDLVPGTVMLMNNRRVMHGRSAFNVESGRLLSGCYVDEDEWRSRLLVELRGVRERGEALW
mmetsp:Transcript_15210/g.52843  ORF Transcript_15210/g.52843 Transcript_15210/m.52843 type:complete len:515 (-) Transcript_15210:113-1657(-)